MEQQILEEAVVTTDRELPELLSYIDGNVEVPAVARGNFLLDPNDLTSLQEQRSCSEEQVERALAAAAAADSRAEWEHTPTLERAELLEKVAKRLSAEDVSNAIALADATTTGAVLSVTRTMAKLAPLSFIAAARYLREGHLEQHLPGKLGEVEYFRRPWGPALLVSPWNGPTAIGSHKIASALAAGAPCIAKPSEWAPHSAVLMAKILHEAGLPQDTFQLVCGNRNMGEKLLTDARIKSISFTGGTAGGRAVANACVHDFKPMQLELGGNNPLVVFADADLELAAKAITFGLVNLNAQWCRALGRVIVHRSIKEQLLERVLGEFSRVRLGSSLDPDSEMGPQIHQGQYQGVLEELERLQQAGGTVMQSTPLPALAGYFIPPTLVDGCSPNDTKAEIFGPVAAVHTFDTEKEARQLANGTDYGLAAYVFSANEDAAFAFSRTLRTGGVKINGYNLLSLSPAAPRGAWGHSGLGEEGTGHTIEFFTGARVVGLAPLAER